MPLDRTWYNTLVDDDGTNTVGSSWDKADVDALMDAIDAALVVNPATCDFRLTLETGVPVSNTDQLAKTTLYCTPNGKGKHISLYDAAGVATDYTSAQFSIAVPATTSTLYSVFVYNNAGVPTLELAAWTNDTTQGTAAYSISSVTGTRTKTGDLTRRFVGLMRTTTVSGQTEDSKAKRYVWNDYSRTKRPFQVTEPTDEWAYSVATIRQANGGAAQPNQLDMVVGVAEVMLHAELIVSSRNNTNDIGRAAGFGEDSTTTFMANQIRNGYANWLQTGANNYMVHVAVIDVYPAIGRHYYSWNEVAVATGVTTWGGDTASGVATMQSGMSGWIDG